MSTEVDSNCRKENGMVKGRSYLKTRQNRPAPDNNCLDVQQICVKDCWIVDCSSLFA